MIKNNKPIIINQIKGKNIIKSIEFESLDNFTTKIKNYENS
jgi:hypothetical protein